MKISIDIGTKHLGWCIFDENDEIFMFGVDDIRKSNKCDMIRSYATNINELLNTGHSNYNFQELLIEQQNFKSSGNIIVQTILICWCLHKKVQYTLFSPN